MRGMYTGALHISSSSTSDSRVDARIVKSRAALVALIGDLLARMVRFVAVADGMAAVRALVDEIDYNRALCQALLTGAGDAMRWTLTEQMLRLALLMRPPRRTARASADG